MPLLGIDELERISPIFRGKAGNALSRALMRFLAVDKVNDLYDRNRVVNGPDFASAVLNDIGMKYDVGFEDTVDMLGSMQDTLSALTGEGPFITISNHPCGHVDGIMLVDLFGHVRPDYKVMVNQILARIEPLEDSFIPVTPTGSSRTAPTAASVSGIKAALKHLRSGGGLGLFPSGAVSDLSLKDRCVRDREWQEAVVRLIMKAQVPVIPVRFFDGNSGFYYSLGLIGWMVRLLRLPAEVFNKKGRTMHIGIGPVISVEEQKRFGTDIGAFRAFLRERVYDMTRD